MGADSASYGTLLGTEFFQVSKYVTGLCICLCIFPMSNILIDICGWNRKLQSSRATTILPTATETVPRILWHSDYTSCRRGSHISCFEIRLGNIIGSPWCIRRCKQMERLDSNCYHLCDESGKYGIGWSCYNEDNEGEEASRYGSRHILCWQARN